MANHGRTGRAVGANKYVNALNTLWLQARWWITFLYITWIIGGLVDLGSDFALGAYYARKKDHSKAYYTIGFALVAGILNIFVVLFGIRRVPVLCGMKVAGQGSTASISRFWRKVIKIVVLFFTICLCGPPMLYFVMMVDHSYDFIDDTCAEIITRTLWISAIVELLVEQVPQTLLQMSITAEENKISPAQLFTVLTSTIGTACTFAGFVDLLARDRKGFFHLLTGRGLSFNEQQQRKTIARHSRESTPSGSKLERIVTVKANNSPGYNSLVFLGLLIFLYMQPVALLSTQFDLSLVFMFLIHAFPVMFMLASKLFGMKYKAWIYTSLSLTFVSVVVVNTIWYGKVSHGWFGGNKFNTSINGTGFGADNNNNNNLGATSEPDSLESKSAVFLPDERTISAAVKQIGNLWSGKVVEFTKASVYFFVFNVCFSSFCFVLGVLTSSFTPYPCCKDDPMTEEPDVNEIEPIKGEEEIDGQTNDTEAPLVKESVAKLQSELTSLKKRMETVETQIKERGDLGLSI